MSDTGKNRRDRASAARDAANAGEKRRERIVRIVGAVTVLVVVIAIIGVAVVVRNQSKDTTAGGATSSASPDPSAPQPTGTLPIDNQRAFGVPYGTATNVPVLEIWEDFQCPACGAVEAANGTGIESLAESGKVQLIWRPTTFLDGNLGNDASERAVAAWGCAIDAGKAKEYHNVVFANQPETEGAGYTDEQLTAFATEAGITGSALDTFTTCFTDRKYLSWSANSTSIFYASQIPGTPLALLNGVEVPTDILVDQPALEKLVADATAAAASASPSPSASPSAS